MDGSMDDGPCIKIPDCFIIFIHTIMNKHFNMIHQGNCVNF